MSTRNLLKAFPILGKVHLNFTRLSIIHLKYDVVDYKKCTFQSCINTPAKLHGSCTTYSELKTCFKYLHTQSLQCTATLCGFLSFLLNDYHNECV